MSERTTMTLEDDVAELIDRETRRSGRPKKDVVNDAIRRGLDRRESPSSAPFTVASRPMGLRPGHELTSISTLLDQLEGPEHR